MKRPVVVLLHSAYWLTYLLLLLVIVSIAGMQIRKTPPGLIALFPVIVLCVAPNVISFYAFYCLLFTRFLVQRKLLALAGFGACVCLISGMSGMLVSLVFFGVDQVIFSDITEFLSLGISLFAIAAIHGGIALVIRGFVTWYSEIKLKEELTQKAFEMELALIKSQIDPHFLFNTINNIDVLITKDPNLASEYLTKFSDILRYMVYETKTDQISLARELGHIEKYLALQKIRTANPDYLDLQITGETANRTITPMILLPFIENAFKHTENNRSDSSIRLRLSVEKDRLVFESENPYRPNSDGTSDFGGLGNDLIRKRLMLTYPDRHHLETTRDDGTYKVKLTLHGN